MSDSMQPHERQYTRLPCPSPSPRVCSDSYTLSMWCHLAISSIVTLFSFCPQSFAASGSFSMSWVFTSGGQSIGTSASASVLPVNIQDWFPFSSVQSLRSVQLLHPMDCSMPGFPVHHQLLELAQTHVHRVSDAIQPSHPLSSPSLPTFNLSQHQGLFWWVSSSHQEAKVSERQLQHQSFQWIFRTDFL